MTSLMKMEVDEESGKKTAPMKINNFIKPEEQSDNSDDDEHLS